MRTAYLLFIVFLLQSFVCFAQEKDSTVVAFEKKIANAQNDSTKVALYLELGSYQLRRDFNLVASYLNKARNIIATTKQQYNSDIQKAEISQQFGLIARRRANYSEAIRYYYEALPIFEKYNDSIGLASSYNNIGNILIYQEEFEKARKILRKAIAINSKLKRSKSIGHNYNILSRAYKANDEVDSLKYFLDKTLAYYTEANYEEGVHQVMSNMSNLYIRQKRYYEALELQLKNLNFVTGIQKKTSIVASHYNLAKIFIELKDYEKALFHINKSLNIAKAEKLGRRYVLSFKRRSLIHNKRKDYYNALEDYRRYSKAYDSIFNISKAREIREIELNHSFEKERYKDSIQFAQEKEVLLLKTENESLQKKWYLALFIISLFMVVVIIYFGNKYLKKLRIRKQLEAKELNSKIDKLSTEISSKKEEITELMAETIIHLNTKEKITENLNKLSKQEEGVSLTGILAELKADKLEDSKLVLLKQNIETLNYEFLKRLREKHPNLTKTDIEVCSFIKLGLTRKEVSELRKTSLEAIKSTRFRLKKKLNLSAQDSLDDFVKSI